VPGYLKQDDHGNRDKHHDEGVPDHALSALESLTARCSHISYDPPQYADANRTKLECRSPLELDWVALHAPCSLAWNAMPDVTAYCDESATEHQVYCVAGYWATTEEWERLAAAWQAQLDAFGLAEFHAQECEQGHGEFAGRDDRPAIFTAFIDLINRFEIHGVFALVDLRGWDEISGAVKELRSPRGWATRTTSPFSNLWRQSLSA
jgi:hypothetical protein